MKPDFLLAAWLLASMPLASPAATPAATSSGQAASGQAASAPASSAAATASTAGARNTYRVEVIVFRQLGTTSGSEDYSASAEGRGFDGKRDVGTGAPTIVRMLDDSALDMTAAAAKMRSSNSVQLLAHKGWIQTATVWGRHVGLPLDQFGILIPNLRGSFYLERGDLLHFGAHLQWFNTDAATASYTLSELRKVRFNEKHFLDHPALGVIVQVSPNR